MAPTRSARRIARAARRSAGRARATRTMDSDRALRQILLSAPLTPGLLLGRCLLVAAVAINRPLRSCRRYVRQARPRFWPRYMTPMRSDISMTSSSSAETGDTAVLRRAWR